MDWKRVFDRPGLVTLGGAPEGMDARSLAEIAATVGDAGVIHVARDDARLAMLAQSLRFFAPGLTVMVLPAWDCLPYDRISPNGEIAARRMDTLSRLAKGVPAGTVLLTTVNAAVQRVPARAVVGASSFITKLGDRVDLDGLTAFLTRSGYNRASTVMEPGEYAVRGGLIDLFPPGSEEPVRLDLFGDTLDSIRRFDPLTQLTTVRLDRLELVPVSEVMLDPASIQRFRAGYRETFGAVTDEDPLYAAVSEGRKQFGMEHWLPLFHEQLDTVFDYLPGALVTLDALAIEARDQRFAAIADYYDARKAALKSGLAEGGAPYKPLPPERLYLNAREWDRRLAGRPVGAFTPFALPPDGATVLDLGARKGHDFAEERTKGANVFEALKRHVAELRTEKKRIVVACYTAGARDRFVTLLNDHGIEPAFAVDSWQEAGGLPHHAVALVVLPLDHGFEREDLAVIAEPDILGDRMAHPRRRARRAENFIAEAGQLAVGDYVVHVDHGIGRYEGLVTLEIGNAPHDCLLIVYDGGDKLYIPVENIDLLSRYGSDDTTVNVDKLGGASWQARKAKLKQRLKDMAEELIKIAAARQLREGTALPPPQGLYDEFCARFPYEETEDQQKAIDDVLDDLSTTRPMDRLVCGDVGFGKTEVALRAAFSAAMGGKQVALVCPTTLLCRQHYKTFSNRFQGLPVRVEQLSRMVTTKQANETKKGLKDGQVDIVVGTHALLAKGMDFRDLGLLIIDEEQHFGVRHKERLKQLKSDIHVLTLSATPIPRTLQLALSGVRELSLITTPPVDRLAVRTYVLPFDPVVVREALLRELYRGGQSFYVCPRIEDLPEAERFLREMVPEVKPAIAHGRLSATELDEIMNAFYDGKYNVLLSTNIVESGLDIPTANTMIIHRADMFGLGQLYQLRGRIGRSKQRAYAYMTVPAKKKLSGAAEKRLKVLQALDTLGAGFTLASHDLDLRGAGNLLGEEQSGHIREVGFELYQELLEEAVAAARGAEDDKAEAEEKWSPQINLGTAVLIPETYVGDLSLRLQFYRRVARLEDKAEIDALAAEMVDRFGPMPDEVRHLLDIVRIKQLCRQAGVDRLEAGPKGAVISFRGNAFANPAGLVNFIARQVGTAKVRPDHKVVFVRDWEDAPVRAKGAQELAATLAKIATA